MTTYNLVALMTGIPPALEVLRKIRHAPFATWAPVYNKESKLAYWCNAT